VTNPKFKLYNARSKVTYRGKFAISSENPQFDIKNLQINDEDQVCHKNRKQVWPTTPTSTNESPNSILPQSTEGSIIDEACGQIKKVEPLGGSIILPSQPGRFPWMVAIYRYFDDEEATYYKCAGTIIDRRTILTSVNCLLEDGLLLNPTELQVYVAPFSLSAKRSKTRTYKIALIIPHQHFNYQLANNIAVLKLTRDIEFNDYVQRVCLPEETYSSEGKLGMVC
jgi:Trypsin